MPGERRDVDRVQLRDRQPQPGELDAALDELRRSRRSARSRSYRSAGPIALIWYGGARYAEFTRIEPPMSSTAVVADDPLAVDRDRLARRRATAPGRACGRPRAETSASMPAPPWRAVLEPERDALAGHGNEPGARAGPPRARRTASSATRRRAGSCASRSPIRPRVARICALERFLLRLQVQGRLDQRRALLGRVPDPRSLARDLRGDEESEHEQGDRRA